MYIYIYLYLYYIHHTVFQPGISYLEDNKSGRVHKVGVPRTIVKLVPLISGGYATSLGAVCKNV